MVWTTAASRGSRSVQQRLSGLRRTHRPHDRAADVFVKILAERKLRGGTGCIKGGFSCVCFSDAPISKLSQILAEPTAHGMRYKPFGIMVAKAWLFACGGRPVIYQTESEFELLHPAQQYRHVRYEPDKVDFTWEREWRIRTDELDLEPDATTVVVPSRRWEEWFQACHMQGIAARAMISGFTGPSSQTKQPWHFVALEDLGVPIPSVEPPKER